MSENDKPSTIVESLETMTVVNIRKVIIEAQAYLTNMAFTATVAVLKAAIGLKLDCTIHVGPVETCDTLQIQVQDASPQKWKTTGKFIATAGSLLDRAGLHTQIATSVAANEDLSVVTALAFATPPKFLEMLDLLRENEETSVTASEALTALFPEEKSDAE